MPSAEREAPLSALRVLELGAELSVRAAGWWLAECGADVETFRADWHAPEPGQAGARLERLIGRLKRSANLEGNAPYRVVIADRGSLDQLLPLVPSELVEQASIVEVTSPYGPTAGHAESLVADMALWARSGLGYLTREMDDAGQPGRPALPLNRQASLLTGVAVALGAVAAAIEGPGADAPRRIAVDKLELLASLPMQPTAAAQLLTSAPGDPTPPTARRAPGGIVASADGMVLLRPVEPAHWATLFSLIDGLEWAADEVERRPELLAERAEELDERLRAWAGAQTSEALTERCQAAHVPIAPILRPDQVVRDAQLADRRFFGVEPEQAAIRLPWLAESGAPTSADPRPEGSSLRTDSSRLPLAGLRVLDLSWAWAGPFTTTMFADLGAEVINVEWHPRASNIRRNAPYAFGHHESPNTSGWWSANQRGKHSIGVNMKEPGGRQVIRDLAARSDVVVENFSPGVVERLGVGYQDLLEANPHLVYVSLSAFGQTGPHSHYVGYGTQVHAAAGASYATSQDGETFSQVMIPYPDPVSGLVGAFATAAYLYQARTADRPSRVDLSELEATACVGVEPLLAALEGDARASNASHDAGGVGYVVVEAADGRFVALIARDEAEWASFSSAVGATEASATSLRAASARLDAEQLLARVAQAGLTAVAIQDANESLRDPALVQRGFWVRDESPEVVETGILMGGAVWHVDSERAPIWRGAPQLFRDTRTVLEQVLEYEPEAVDQLFAAGAVE